MLTWSDYLSFILFVAFIGIVPSFAAALTSPCNGKTGSTVCKLVWSSNGLEGFKSSNVDVHQAHSGVHDVVCTLLPETDIFSNGNKTLKISYLGKKNGLKQTCYTYIYNLINPANRNDNHGYVEATILIKNDLGLNELNPQSWPAFWLTVLDKKDEKNGPDAWPKFGEIDIAEGLGNTNQTSTNLHGDENAQGIYAINGIQIGKLASLGLYDNNHYHIYGLEWELLNNSVILNIYYDDIFQYSTVGDATQKPYFQIKKGLQSGKMILIFDTDQGPEPSFNDAIRYSMTVSNVNVYSIAS